jgi:NAD(P)-dependent dehydrogenase (short-subunit alcohol dehydrogenase family)
MKTSPQWDFAGQVVVVTGAASGIGAAVVDRLLETDATVHTLDIAAVGAPVAAVHRCDLGDRRAIDAVLSVLPERIDMLMNCAGVPNGGRFTPGDVMAINWLGLRHLTEAVLDRIPAGGSITHVASTAGRGWSAHVGELVELMLAPTFEAGAEWVDVHPDIVGDGYALSKEAVQYYTMWRALQVRPERDVRMNSICPGVTNTALAEDFRRGVGDDVIERATQIAGRLAEPAEMAPAMLFLADERSASYINGVNLNVDRGTGAAHAIGAW